MDRYSSKYDDYSHKIGLKFTVYIHKDDKKTIVFEDKTVYDNNELNLLKGVSKSALKNIHKIKKTFRAQIIKK